MRAGKWIASPPEVASPQSGKWENDASPSRISSPSQLPSPRTCAALAGNDHPPPTESRRFRPGAARDDLQLSSSSVKGRTSGTPRTEFLMSDLAPIFSRSAPFFSKGRVRHVGRLSSGTPRSEISMCELAPFFSKRGVRHVRSPTLGLGARRANTPGSESGTPTPEFQMGNSCRKRLIWEISLPAHASGAAGAGGPRALTGDSPLPALLLRAMNPARPG